MSASHPKINLLVLRSADIDHAVKFYAVLGLSFDSEKHGDGPVHYSSACEGVVLEIYPLKAGTAEPTPIRFGMAVKSVDDAVAALELAGASCVKQPHDSKFGRRAVMKDFDGNRIEFSESIEGNAKNPR